ncbi:integrase [Caulobacter ginsengisoli]|uniref:Integrase n=1 Tax=Caulobacter ginsengisoli TaxID=400775 RepID=A0ABU0ILS9_9CAUL|nr:site-specific integrase [Caulobacter ginsengisoli]MDQ0462967.1 integrase [Caulobacter ginsengisoli]
MTTHLLFDGRVQIYRRGAALVWQCAARVDGHRFRHSTGEENLERATAFAEEWYLDLRGRVRTGQPLGLPDKPKRPERTFADAADEFIREVRVLAAGSRSPLYIAELEIRLKASILPFFGKLDPSTINRSTIQSYVVKRTEDMQERRGRSPARSTILSDMVVIRQVLKHEEGAGRLPFMPNLSLPYLTLKKKGRRAWFSPEEYEKLYKATRQRIATCPRRGWKSQYEDLHDFVLLMGNTGLRPDEALNAEIRDVQIEQDDATGETILVIDVRGKTGTGFCKSMPGAVHPFRRLRARRLAELEAEHGAKEAAARLATTNLFLRFNREAFNRILREEGLRFDRDGKRRTAYSLRHTYISMRLMEGANIHQIANNCRTSVQMIEEHYASHIKDRLDASAINVRRPKAKKPAAGPRPRAKGTPRRKRSTG